jgi:hypothetical protein
VCENNTKYIIFSRSLQLHGNTFQLAIYAIYCSAWLTPRIF